MPPVAAAILIVTLVAVSGLVLGGIRIRGIGLGPAGVLFSGILFGHFGASIDHEIADFTKEFGLILFVFTIGLQLGPGVIELWKKQGILLNSMALSIVVQAVVLICIFVTVLELPALTSAGLFSGATTNTPSLGAAEQAALSLSEDNRGGIGSLASAYAVAYPGGILGIIASMLLIRRIFGVDVNEEAAKIKQQEKQDYEPIERRSIVIDNPHLGSVPFGKIPGVEESGVRVSRIRRAGEDVVHVATDETELRDGDLVQLVGPLSELDRIEPVIGRKVDVDLMKEPGEVAYRRILVTDPRALRKPLRELSLDQVFNTTVTRIIRSGVELTVRGSSRFNYGDIAHIVGDKESIERATKFLGNSGKSMKETRFSPLFFGIAVGVVAGMIPFHLPGVPFPIRLGFAGGPLIAAIVFSLIGSIGKFVWYIPYSANLALRELGIILFLACAGLGAGETFFKAALSVEGIKWMGLGIIVTMVPLLTTGIAARVIWKQNFLTICGVIAGSMTDPPALAFANSQADSDASSTAYAAVYPLTMILRIIAAQAIVMMFA
ncbi:putative transporter [Stieleria mannarensis]|uniref:putative transporter n=1 Tax=Stieleria mannarensis TaxID=2755585 RepID=UPI0015FFEACD|nr:putative transporter [Rhodopirellula sp. JC639]